MSFPGLPQDAGTVSVRVQVIDAEPFALDLVVATYMPARDVTTRIARDAGLGAFWEDGTRRSFWLRARGRVLGEDEKLQDLGVVNGELLHLLPQPPPGSPVIERPPEYPPIKGYAGAGWPQVIGSLLLLILWTIGWGLALSAHQGIGTGLWPSIGLALMSTSFARHLWGGEGSSVKVPITGIPVYFALLVCAAGPSLVLAYGAGQDPVWIGITAGSAVVGGVFGITMGWLAWYGAVEPLPKRIVDSAKKQTQVQLQPCGVCGQGVDPSVITECVYKCGRVFHTGCYAAKRAVGPQDACAVCGWKPA